MESCVQDIVLIREALNRRKNLLQYKGIPAQYELFQSQGQDMGNIVLDGMTHVAKELMDAGRVHKIPKTKLWIPPESRINGEICVSQAPNIDFIKALTHEGVLEIGSHIEMKYEKKFLKMLKKAIEETSEFERFECERRLKFALKVQHEIYIKKLNELEDKLREEFEQEKLQIQSLYDKKYGQILCDVVKNTNEKYRNKIADLKEKKPSVVCISSSSLDTESSAAESFASTPSTYVERKIPDNSAIQEPIVDVAKKLWNDFEHHLRTQRNILQCSNTTDLVHFICTEKLESQKRVENVKKECCEKIELLKSYLFDICCKVRCIECQCPPEQEKQAPQPICISAEFCRCKHKQVCLDNDPGKTRLVCSCCGKKVDDRICGGVDPKKGKGKGICRCTETDLKNQDGKCKTVDGKVYCRCGKNKEPQNEVKAEKDEEEEKKLCCVCRARQICEIVGKMKWPTPPKPPCICFERKYDPTIPCHCQHNENEKGVVTSERHNDIDSTKFDHATAAIVFPAYIGEQMFCECHSSSSEDDCPCLDANADDELLQNNKAAKICWTQVPDNECVQLLDDSKNHAFDESSSSSVPSVCKSEKAKANSSDNTSVHSRYSCREFKNKLMKNLNAEELVDYIFQLSTPESLLSPEYIKRRLSEEIQKKLEEIFTQRESKVEEISSDSSSEETTRPSESVQPECDKFVDELLELGRKRTEPEPCKPAYFPVPDELLPEDKEIKLVQTTHETWKSFIPLPKYLVPVASLFEGGWSYKQTTDEEWKNLLELIEKNKKEDKDCVCGKQC